ncbi:hypothetical protein ES703_71741 [subsurface metagenome]
MRLRAIKKQSQNKPNFRNGQNECKLKYNKGLWQFSALWPPTKTNPILPPSPLGLLQLFAVGRMSNNKTI